MNDARQPYRPRWSYLSDYERGRLDALREALSALDGHSMRDTAHERVRRLLACSECSHGPDEHGEDGVCCHVHYFRGDTNPCQCIEWEPPASGPSEVAP